MSNRFDPGAALQRALDTDTDHLAALHDQLVAKAAADGLVDVAYRIVDSPIGSLLLAATDAGLVRVAFFSEGHDRVLHELSERISPRLLHHPARLDVVATELDDYFGGRRQSFGVPIDWQLSAGFRAEVLQHLHEIGYGHTASYAAVARLAGRPKAFRAVGTACATNPLPVVVPCHRVVKSDGGMGGYLGGPDAKTVLLELEGAA